MPRYQIEFKGLTHSSYVYFDAEDNIGEKACEVADKEVERGRAEPAKKIIVREFDEDSKCVISKGHRFTLHLRTLKAIHSTGDIILEQYYQSLYR